MQVKWNKTKVLFRAFHRIAKSPCFLCCFSSMAIASA